SSEARMADLHSRLRTATAPAQAPAPAPAKAAVAAAPVAAPPKPAVRPVAINTAAAPVARAAATPVAEAPVPAEPVVTIPVQATIAHEPLAAARESGITIAPFTPQANPYMTGDVDVDLELQGQMAEPAHEPEEAPFIPPAVEAPAQRMPRVEDFPPVAQRQLEAQQAPQPQEEDRGPLSLLRRLASVGLGRREEDPLTAQPRTPPPAPRQQPPRLQQPQRAQTPPPGGDYAKRP